LALPFFTLEDENGYERRLVRERGWSTYGAERHWVVTCSSAGAIFGILLTFSIIIKSVLTFHYFKYTNLPASTRIHHLPIVFGQNHVWGPQLRRDMKIVEKKMRRLKVERVQ